VGDGLYVGRTHLADAVILGSDVEVHSDDSYGEPTPHPKETKKLCKEISEKLQNIVDECKRRDRETTDLDIDEVEITPYKFDLDEDWY